MTDTLEMIHEALVALGYDAERQGDALVPSPSEGLPASIVLRPTEKAIRIGLLASLPEEWLEASAEGLALRLNDVTPIGEWSLPPGRNALAWRASTPWDGSRSAATLQRRLAGHLRLCAGAVAALTSALRRGRPFAEMVEEMAAALESFQPQREQLPARERVETAEWREVLTRLGCPSQFQS